MRRFVILGILFTVLCSLVHAEKSVTLSEVEIRFLNKDAAGNILQCDDAFLQQVGAFDRGARLQTDQIVSMEEFKAFIVRQPLDWDAKEVQLMTTIVEVIKKKAAQLRPLFPPVINLVKTTGLEEGNAIYCRCENTIVFSSMNLSMEAEQLQQILTHELFHILSRNNMEIREQLYGVVGFLKTTELTLDSALSARKITNPDAARNDYYFTTTMNNDTLTLMPILLAKSAYDMSKKGVFFEYAELQFIAVEVGQDQCKVRYVNSNPTLLEPSQVPKYFELIGKNTEYIIHPEEVLADNFALMIHGAESLPTPEIIDRMKKILLK